MKIENKILLELMTILLLVIIIIWFIFIKAIDF